MRSLTTKNDKTNTQHFERRRFNIMTEETSDRDGGPYIQYDNHGQKPLIYLHAMKI